MERFLIWGVGVLAPAVALWRRPADWGSLLFVRQPLASRNSDQLRISASQGGLGSRAAVVIAAVILLPVLWWMDDSAVLASEFSPVSGQSRLVTLLLVSPLLALMVWQVQQLMQARSCCCLDHQQPLPLPIRLFVLMLWQRNAPAWACRSSTSLAWSGRSLWWSRSSKSPTRPSGWKTPRRRRTSTDQTDQASTDEAPESPAFNPVNRLQCLTN